MDSDGEVLARGKGTYKCDQTLMTYDKLQINVDQALIVTPAKLWLEAYATDENWQDVNLKEERDFASNKKYIYVFKLSSERGENQRDDDGAKRVFFGEERFIGVSGQAYVI
ncbi:hypothetical protein F2P56_031357 [Juglans regia]|uniref:Uncharacterized protein n=1 Tax=Juglans regia TaxID=51240 RepID=A0A833WIH8_JUGRE|nr:hypothetical protein F2P56_031357 [Juglans regia]